MSAVKAGYVRLEGLVPVTDLRLQDNKTLAQRAADAIEDAIIHGSLRPGQPLREQELAELVGVSRQSVRESFRLLQLSGLVEVRPRRGAFVTEPSRERASDLFLVREALEGMAARLAAGRASDDQIARVSELHQRVRLETASTPEFGYPQRKLDFHAWVVEASGSDGIRSSLVSTGNQLKLLRVRSGSEPDRALDAITEHDRILGAIRRRDPDAAEREMRRHIAAAREHLLALTYKEHP